MRIKKVTQTTPVQAEVVDSLDGNSTTNAPSVRAVNENVPKKWKYVVPNDTYSIDFDIKIDNNEILNMTIIQNGSYNTNTSLYMIPNDLSTFNTQTIRTGAIGSATGQSGINSNNDYLVTTGSYLSIASFAKEGIGLNSVMIFIQNNKLCSKHAEARLNNADQRYLNVFNYISNQTISNVTKFKLQTTDEMIKAGTIFIFERI